MHRWNATQGVVDGPNTPLLAKNVSALASYIREGLMRDRMVQGTIARYMGDKGFGFIKTDASNDDVFFHMSAFEGGEPREGQTVEFEIEQADRGPRAKNVRAV